MKNIKFSKFKFLVGFLLLSFCLESQYTLSVFALNYTDVNSPILQNYHATTVLNKDNLPIGDVKAHFKNDDKLVNIRFDGLADIEDNEKYVVVFKDVHGHKKDYYAHLDKNTKDCSVVLDYFRTFEDILVYKQKNNEKDNEEKEENFVCKTRFLLSHDYDYNRDADGATQEITPLNKNGGKISSMVPGHFRSKNTPNIYSIDPVVVLQQGGAPTTYGFIVLKEEQENLMTLDQRTVPLTYKDGSLYGYVFDFYLPPEIKEFTFVVYRRDTSDLRYKYDIKLERK